MKASKDFEHGAAKERFDDLADYMDKNDFSCADFLAVVCAHISGYPQKVFETELACGGYKWKIRLEKEPF